MQVLLFLLWIHTNADMVPRFQVITVGFSCGLHDLDLSKSKFLSVKAFKITSLSSQKFAVYGLNQTFTWRQNRPCTSYWILLFPRNILNCFIREYIYLSDARLQKTMYLLWKCLGLSTSLKNLSDARVIVSNSQWNILCAMNLISEKMTGNAQLMKWNRKCEF
jgi:hypothetical protein